MTNDITDLFPFIFLIFVFLVFAFVYVGGKLKADCEVGKTPIFQEQCGGRFDGINLSAPFVRHSLYDDFMLLAYGNAKIVLHYTEIVEVSLEKHILSKGISISHNRKDLSQSIIVWSFSPEKVMKIFGTKNISIKTTNL
ncbi:hypothetical protein [Desulforegula conservatrix]|uniref:hypothetical protein n=1 Tax=Desulforegula conservatrix TaxID=153026 RepID=UPI00048A031D|nr:hypothetical protein [Desulforegula conservatrix]